MDHPTASQRTALYYNGSSNPLHCNSYMSGWLSSWLMSLLLLGFLWWSSIFPATQRAEKYCWESDPGKWYVDKYSQVDGCQILQRESKNSPTTTAKMAKLRYQVSPVAFWQQHSSPSLSPPLMLHWPGFHAMHWRTATLRWCLCTSYTSH